MGTLDFNLPSATTETVGFASDEYNSWPGKQDRPDLSSLWVLQLRRATKLTGGHSIATIGTKLSTTDRGP